MNPSAGSAAYPSPSPSPSPSASERFQSFAASAKNSASTLLEGTAYAAELIGPYMAQFQKLYNVITSTDPNMTQEAKATAIIDMITSQAVSQVTEMAGQKFATSQTQLVNLIRQLNIYKKRICSVVVNVNQARVVFDFITKNPAFISQLKTKLGNINPNEIQNIINNPTKLATPNTPNTDDCERQIDNMLNQLFPGFSGGNKYKKNKKTKSKRRTRSRKSGKRRKSIRKR
jgi:hypothetical protein